MTTYEERKRQSQAFFKATPGPSKETTPAELNTLHSEFSKRLCESGAPEFVPVEDDAYGLFGFCEDGVREKIRNDAGSIMFGWVIWEWPGVLLTAEFHAVWASPTGRF
jgi:hypothetical protein